MPVTPGSSPGKGTILGWFTALLAAGALSVGVLTFTSYGVFTEIAEPAVSSAGTVRIYADSTSHTLKVSANGGAYAEIGGGIDNVVEDTTPQLGGNLDVNGNAIVSVSDGNIPLKPNGSGVVQLYDGDGSSHLDAYHDGAKWILNGNGSHLALPDNVSFSTTAGGNFATAASFELSAFGAYYGVGANARLETQNGYQKNYGGIRFANVTEGTGTLNIQTAREAHTLAAAATSTTTINLPSNVLIVGVQMCVNTAVTDDAGDDTWSAELNDGAGIGTIVTGATAAKNTKVNKLFVPILTDATTNIVFTPNGGSFSAGVIECIVHYMDLTSMANEP